MVKLLNKFFDYLLGEYSAKALAEAQALDKLSKLKREFYDLHHELILQCNTPEAVDAIYNVFSYGKYQDDSVMTYEFYCERLVELKALDISLYNTPPR